MSAENFVFLDLTGLTSTDIEEINEMFSSIDINGIKEDGANDGTCSNHKNLPSWSNLFKYQTTVLNEVVVPAKKTPENNINLNQKTSFLNDNFACILKDFIVSSLEDNDPILCHYRSKYNINEGPLPLNNFSNWCYVNSVMQALFCIPQFFQFFYNLGLVYQNFTSVINNLQFHLGDNKNDTFKISAFNSFNSVPVTKSISLFLKKHYHLSLKYKNSKADEEVNAQILNIIQKSICLGLTSAHLEPSDNNNVENIEESASDVEENSSNITNPRRFSQRFSYRIGLPVNPDIIYDIVPVIQADFRGRQQDAEEFLSCLLNSLHEEFLEIKNQGGSGDKKTDFSDSKAGPIPKQSTSQREQSVEGESSVDSSDDWETRVGKRGNKSCLVRETKMPESPISILFGGTLCSSVFHKQCCNKNSTNIQPFFVLPLDIDGPKLYDLYGALRKTFAREPINDYLCMRSNTRMNTYKSLTLRTEDLPSAAIIFQFKSFYFENGNSLKLLNSLSFPTNLILPKDVISPTSLPYSPSTFSYKLRSVIFHMGSSLQGGHYFTLFRYSQMVPQQRDQDFWYLADDSLITEIRFPPCANAGGADARKGSQNSFKGANKRNENPDVIQFLLSIKASMHNNANNQKRGKAKTPLDEDLVSRFISYNKFLNSTLLRKDCTPYLLFYSK